MERDKVLMDGLQRAVRIMKSVNNVEDLKLYSYLHYEQLRYQLSGLSSVRLANGRVHRLLFIEEEDRITLTLVELDETHYGNR